MRQLLACFDFSAGTDLVAKCAADLARGAESKIVFLHIVAPEPDFVGLDVGPQSVRDAIAKRMSESHKELQELAKRYAAGGLDITPLTIQGPTVAKIVEHAGKMKADYIIVGAHGRSAVYELLVGSVTKGVLRESTVPVVVVPHRA